MVTDNKHTPGPWRLEVIETHYVADKFLIHDSNMDVVTMIVDYNGATANARLIATAPELLKELEEVREVLSLLASGVDFSTVRNHINNIDKVIAKATGKE